MSKKNSPVKPPLALIAGPTASGKSDLAVRLAQAVECRGRHAVVINADSAQVYADLRVLSARPDAAEMGGIEHKLFGVWDGARPCSAADWAEAAKGEIERAHAKDALPILVGGTGLYFRTLLDGIAPVPSIDPAVRAAVRAMPQAAAREALEREDPQAAARLAPADNARTSRALEVILSTGKPLAHWHKRKEGGVSDQVSLHPLVLLPPRDWLVDRCDRRFRVMIEQGAREEVEKLLVRNLDPDLPVMRAIGVGEIARWIYGKCGREEAIEAGQTATRQYAKRQYTWFRHQPPAHWHRELSNNYVLKDIFASIFLNKP